MTSNRVEKQSVVTYQHAYLTHLRIDLCARHTEQGGEPHPMTERLFGVLGPVSHGAHDGLCEMCDAERVGRDA